MSTKYCLELPDELNEPQRKGLDQYAEQNPPSPPLPEEKHGDVDRLLTRLEDNEELELEERTALALSSIGIPLALEAIAASPGALDAQCRRVVDDLRKSPAVRQVKRILMGQGLPDDKNKTGSGHQQADGQVAASDFGPSYQPNCASPCEVASVDLSCLENLPDPEKLIDTRDVLAFGIFLRTHLLGEGAGLLLAADELCERWADNCFDPSSPNLCNLLYCWNEEANRYPPAKRANLAVCLGFPYAANHTDAGFAEYWNTLVAAFGKYVDGLNYQPRINRGTTDILMAASLLKAYCDSVVNGPIRMQINDFAAQLVKAIEILGFAEVHEWFAPGKGGFIWAPVPGILTDFSIVDIISSFDTAEAIREIFEWLLEDQCAAAQKLEPPFTGELRNAVETVGKFYRGERKMLPASVGNDVFERTELRGPVSERVAP